MCQFEILCLRKTKSRRKTSLCWKEAWERIYEWGFESDVRFFQIQKLSRGAFKSSLGESFQISRLGSLLRILRSDFNFWIENEPPGFDANITINHKSPHCERKLNEKERQISKIKRKRLTECKIGFSQRRQKGAVRRRNVLEAAAWRILIRRENVVQIQIRVCHGQGHASWLWIPTLLILIEVHRSSFV